MRKYRGPVVEVSPIYSTPGALGGWMIDRIRIGAASGSLDSAIAIPRETILEELGRRGGGAATVWTPLQDLDDIITPSGLHFLPGCLPAPH